MDTMPMTAEEVVCRIEEELAEVPLEISEGCEEEPFLLERLNQCLRKLLLSLGCMIQAQIDSH